MNVNLNRLLSLLLAVMLVIGLPISAMAATVDGSAGEAEPTIPTEETAPAPLEATAPQETEVTEPATTDPTEETEPPATGQTEPAEETPTEEATAPAEELPLSLMSLDDGVATIADTEIVGAPNAFGNVFLLNGGIDIPAFDHVQHKEHLPLYSVYLKNQPGYENNYYVAYCIEPGVVLGESGGHSGSSTTIGGMTDGTGALERLSREQVEAMGVVLMYGQREIARRADAESVRLQKLRRHAATQAIIWEIACGWRSATPPYTLYDSTFYDAIVPPLECAVQVWGTKFYLDGIDDAYNEIVAQMELHYKIPSFMKSSKSSAPTYELIADGNGKYSITLTDTNNILSQYTFTNTSNLTFSVSGNKLTITANGPISDTLVAPTKQVPNLDSQVFYVWEYKEQQKLMSCKTEPVNSPMPAYFYVTAPDQTASLDLTKTTEDGKNLSGWKFGIYSDSGCSNLISGPHTTDANGKISVADLTAGTVYVKELGHTDSTINALYSCDSTNPQKVVLIAGDNAKVSFHNRLNTGNAKLVKQTNTGKDLSGWMIGLYYDAACTNAVTGSPFTTGTDGTITVTGLKPGTLYAKEIPTDDPYWEFDTSIKEVKIVANQTATVTFANTHYGYLKIIKETNTEGSLSGWKFSIYTDAACTQLVSGSPFVSGEDGTIAAQLLPATYFVVEVDESDKYPDWVFDTKIHVVTVEAGQTASVTIRNTQQGKLKLIKAMPDGGSAAGWEFDVHRVSDDAFIGSFTCGEDGRILISKLQPGEYRITEKIPEDSIYYCEAANPQTVTVVAGQTVEVTFTNRLKPAEIVIQKVDTTGDPLAGSVFLLEWSTDGVNWAPVTHTDSPFVTEGTCTSEGVVDGCLTSPQDGMVRFSGLHPERQYRLTEVSAPEGYQLLAGPAYEGSIPIGESLTVSLTVVNAPVYELPMTGSKSFIGMAVSLCICIAGCVGALIHLRRKDY